MLLSGALRRGVLQGTNQSRVALLAADRAVAGDDPVELALDLKRVRAAFPQVAYWCLRKDWESTERRTLTMTENQHTQQEFPPAAAQALRQGNKVEAIRIVRETWDVGLKEAKEAVEAYQGELPAMPKVVHHQRAKSAFGWIWWLLLAIVLLLVVRKLEGMA